MSWRSERLIHAFSHQIYLKRLSEKTGSKIYGKAEFQNPGGSVKDRAALGIVKDAEASGRYVLVFCMTFLHRFESLRGDFEIG